MSLHGKVVAWFAFFASVIVTLFVLGDYYQSTRALRVALEARAQVLAGQAATDLERRYEHALADLKEFGREFARSGHVNAGVDLASFSTVRVWRNGRLHLDTTGNVTPAKAYPCAFGSVPFRFEFLHGPGELYQVEASMSTSEFLLPISVISAPFGGPGITSVMNRADGSLIFDAGCAIRSTNVPRSFESLIAGKVLATPSDGRRTWITEVQPGSDADLYLVAFGRSGHPAWSVAVALNYNDFAAPFATARTQYLAIMIGFMLLVLVFTLRMIRVDMRRLSAIAQAADAVGHGRFDVWLPPPTGDEVGRLSLALGRMVNRLASTVRQAEITAAMAAVGELATYLSHEIRNPLSSLRLNLQMLRRDLQSGAVVEDQQELLDVCLTEMQRLDDVVKTVLDVGRRGRTKIGVCDAHEVIKETVHLMRSRLAGQGVEVTLHLDAYESEVAIDAAKLKSVVINLLLNSVDAMAASPRKAITITTAQHGLQDATQFELRLRDSGPGVPPELAGQIFEPFFTTKAEGSGIGLATALRIVKECRGTLRCNPVHAGETGGDFVVDLPLAQTASEDAEQQAALAVAG